MKALEPAKIIHSEGGGAYACKTRLGWCVVGPINCISKGITTSCNRAAVRDVALCNGEVSQGCQFGGNVSSNVQA